MTKIDLKIGDIVEIIHGIHIGKVSIINSIFTDYCYLQIDDRAFKLEWLKLKT